jgi:hypothetical protein
MRRPPQNYFHAVLGLAIIALALYQVHSGYDTEYRLAISNPLPNSVHIIWIIWVVVSNSRIVIHPRWANFIIP